MFIKVCGITRLSDALHAAAHGATALGFVFWPPSPRYVTPGRAAEMVAALPAGITAVGVFVNASVDDIRAVRAKSGIAAVQLHGDEAAEYAAALDCPVLRRVGMDGAEQTFAAWPADTTFLIDAEDRVRRGGTGVSVDWNRAATLARGHRVVLAGGLTPANVSEAIAAVRPYGVDVSSGVEEAPGVKDVDKVAWFLANARSAFETR
jgi:phosphoribosylanthranilate isomerase